MGFYLLYRGMGLAPAGITEQGCGIGGIDKHIGDHEQAFVARITTDEGRQLATRALGFAGDTFLIAAGAEGLDHENLEVRS
jgi:hypothetical protein